MLKINALSRGDINKHLTAQKDAFERHLRKWRAPYIGYPPFTYEFACFLRENVDSILVGGVSTLNSINNEISERFPDFTAYLKNRPEKGMHNYCQNMENLIKDIQGLFNYDAFSKRKTSWGAYELVRAHGIRVCPYCQLHHVNYYVSNEGGGFRMRPPLDHFYPKSIYPYLGVSLFNLIPSCSQCNSGVKGDDDPGETLPHPMDNKSNLVVDFQIIYKSLSLIPKGPDDIDLIVKCNGLSQRFVDFFQLQERYEWYKPEIFDMFLRKNNFDQLDAQWRNAMSSDIFVLGFSPCDVRQRALGLCLEAIARGHNLI